MARKAVVDAVETRLAAQWNTTAIVGLNEESDPPKDGSEFIQVQYPVSNETQMSTGAPGANFWREEGTFRIVIHAQRGRGKKAALAWADTIAAIFRGQRFDGVNATKPVQP